MKTIKDMPEHSRPREKLREKGASALTDEELVAAILGMGTAGVDVRTIARQAAGTSPSAGILSCCQRCWPR
jgi:DNA repair protein RadC